MSLTFIKAELLGQVILLKELREPGFPMFARVRFIVESLL